MAVSLKKGNKVDLSKPNLPPKVREYTPVHLIDEEETIVNRSRLPSSQPERTVKENTPDVSINTVYTDIDPRTFRDRHSNFASGLFAIAVIGIVILVLLAVLLYRLAPSEKASPKSTPVETVSDVVTSVVVPTENVTVEETSSIDDPVKALSGFIYDVVSYVLNNPICIGFLGLAFILLAFRIARNIIYMGRRG